MSREVTADFQALKNYIGAYSIQKKITESDYILALKSMHKKYFAAISFNAEMWYKKKEFIDRYAIDSDKILDYISESISDIGSSMFNWINGNYKTARIMQRAAIENFVRAISSIENSGQLIEKNVYKLFKNASTTKIICKNEKVKELYNSLHNDYKLLCRDTHTASKQNMDNITSLAEFPSFQLDKAKDCKNVFIRVVEKIIAIFCLLFNKFFHSMHRKNKENIINSLPSILKPIVNGVEL